MYGRRNRRGRGARAGNRRSRFRGRPRGRQGVRRGFGGIRFRPGGLGIRARRGNQGNYRQLVPDAAFTRSNIGKETEHLQLINIYGSDGFATYEEVLTAWANGTNTTNPSVVRLYFNYSSLARKMVTGVPTAVSSKRTIERVSGVTVQGHSTKCSIHLAGGRKMYNATAAFEKVTGVTVSESNPYRGFHTTRLRLPNKAVMVNQKGYKLVKMTPPGFGALELDYAHIGDLLCARGGDILGGAVDPSVTIMCLMLKFVLHTTPNPDYVSDDTVFSAPDVMVVLDYDPSVMLQGYNPDPAQSIVSQVADAEFEIKRIPVGYLARTRVVNMVPAPVEGVIYEFSRPVYIVKGTGVSVPLSYCKVQINPNDTSAGLMLYLYERKIDMFANRNLGQVADSILQLPSGLKLTPLTNFVSQNFEHDSPHLPVYKPGDRVAYMFGNPDISAVRKRPVDTFDDDNSVSVLSDDEESVVSLMRTCNLTDKEKILAGVKKISRKN